MLRLWKAKHILVCSIASVLGIGLAYGQTYPNFNGGNLTNNNPPPTGGPSQQIIQMPSGTIVTENGLQPGAQVNVVLVQGTASWTQSQTQTLENAVNTGISQSGPGVPDEDYPPPNYQSADSLPTINQNTGFEGATTQNVISVIVAVAPADLPAGCTNAGACTANTIDPSTGYVTSSLTYISSSYQTGTIEEAEIVAHGLDSLTDCTSCNSLANVDPSLQAPGFTESDVNNPQPEPVSPCSDPCANQSCQGYTCDACGTDCNGTCQTNDDCPGGLVCMGGTCGCSNPCDDQSCSGYSCDSCGTNCSGTCTTNDDCPGGLVCMGGTCGCSNSCDDPSCSGYDPCECVGTCADPSCPGYDPCTCE